MRRSTVTPSCGFLPSANDAKRCKLAFVNRIRIIPKLLSADSERLQFHFE